MPLTFAQADALFRQDRLNDLVADVEERRYLKLRSLNRTEYLERLFQTAGIPRPDVGARQLFDAAFNAGINTAMIGSGSRPRTGAGHWQARRPKGRHCFDGSHRSYWLLLRQHTKAHGYGVY